MDKISEAIGKHVVSPIIQVVDVDGVVQRIDLNEALTNVDLDSHLDRVDINRLLERVDIDRLVKRVDVNDLVLRSDIGSIIAHSTTGIFTQALDALRTQVVLLDLLLYRLSSGCHFGEGKLPPRPGNTKQERSRNKPYPKGRVNKAIAVQGRYTGFISKALAILADGSIVTLTFAVLLIIFELCWMFLSKSGEEKNVDRHNRYVVAIFCLYWFSYFFLSVLIAGKTIGMALVGIRVVNARNIEEEKGSHNSQNRLELTVSQVLVRTLLLPLSTTLFPFLGIFGFFRRDGRMLHDWIASTGIIYRWHAKMAKMRERTVYQQLDHQTSSNVSVRDDDEDEDDEEDPWRKTTPNTGSVNRNLNGRGFTNSSPKITPLLNGSHRESGNGNGSRSQGYTTFGEQV